MEAIEIFDNITDRAAKGIEVESLLSGMRDREIFSSLYLNYRCAQRCDAPCIYFENHIWDKEIAPLCKTMERCGITKIAVTSTSTGLMGELDQFQRYGWKVTALENIPIDRLSRMTKDGIRYEKRPAIILVKK